MFVLVAMASPSPPTPLPEGEGREAHSNPLEHAVRIPKDIAVGKPQHDQACGLEHGVPYPVPPRAGEVPGTIQLDHEPSFLAEEVHDVRSQRLLPPELDPELPPAKQRPQSLLGASCASPKRAGSIGRSTQKPRRHSSSSGHQVASCLKPRGNSFRAPLPPGEGLG